MTTMEITKEAEGFLAEFERLERNGGLWMAEKRRAAMELFAQRGYPSHRRDENWRHTNLRPLHEHQFRLAGAVELSAADRELLQRHIFAIPGASSLVFVNGRYQKQLSTIDKLPQGAVATNLRNALSTRAAEVERQLTKYVALEEHPFAALNTAFMTDGAFISVPAGAVLEAPLQIVHFTKSGGEPVASYPRNLFLAGENSRFGLIETYIGGDNDIYLLNAVTEIVLDDNAIVDHLKYQNESDDAFHFTNAQIDQERDSRLLQTAVTIGGRLTRNDLGTLLNGEGAHCQLNGLYLPRGEQHMDTHTRMDHAKPHCTSKEIYKGILDGRASGVFNGKIDVRQDAQKTDAIQSNHALLLAREATIHTRPQLEIYADDVKCTHGATVGELDEKAVYYLRTRGIDERTARAMMIAAFAYEIVEDIQYAAVREAIHRIVEERFLPQTV